MAMKIPLGRLAGIPVSTDPSVPILAAIYTVVLAQRRFPFEHPDLPTSAYWVAGIAGALLFFGSLLVHELGHALVAKEEGIGVAGISLWFLGGMARLRSAPTTAASEFKIAVVGPIASAACGVVMLTGSYLLPDEGLGGLAGSVLGLLGFINLVLAAFNILPAAPLDGGTVLSSMIWKRTGSQVRGMRVSAIVGLLAGTALVWVGLSIGRRGGPAAINGWSLLIVGAFILFAAWQSLRSQPLMAVLDGVIVADAVEPAPVARGAESIADLLRRLPDGTDAQAFPVVDDRGMAAGLLVSAAIRAADRSSWETLSVSDLAFPLDRVTIVGVDEPLLPAVQKIDSGPVRDGLVVDGHGSVIGVVDSRALYRIAEARRAGMRSAS